MIKKILFSLLLLSLLADLAAAEKKYIKLPEPKIIGKMPLEEAVFRRRSWRSFHPNDLTLDQISQLLWAGQGITDKSWGFRAAPSSGSLYPLNLYIAKKDGVFEYVPDGNKLVEISKEDKRGSIVRASLGQQFIGEAPCVIIICGNFRITQAKFGQRSYRYINMEVGHAAENILLQAVALGLGAVPVGAFWDDVIAKLLDLPDTRDPFYLIPVGYPKSEQ
ncbi:MAG: SagB/ThcOx family dehydrogenase [Candidatus Margulisbacteria bacterium]|nr:SagB/ThcOx family dehydrogenase [Candidatus Margulisiibacteriota bacterium]MBU1616820.1 SagB/ThcOx family dehydrogenase [Candidatus Margulisiibacteriota bacterium]